MWPFKKKIDTESSAVWGYAPWVDSKTGKIMMTPVNWRGTRVGNDILMKDMV